jgi:hypothetical protein
MLEIPNIKIIPIDKLAPYPALITANVVIIPSTLTYVIYKYLKNISHIFNK